MSTTTTSLSFFKHLQKYYLSTKYKNISDHFPLSTKAHSTKITSTNQQYINTVSSMPTIPFYSIFAAGNSTILKFNPTEIPIVTLLTIQYEVCLAQNGITLEKKDG